MSKPLKSLFKIISFSLIVPSIFALGLFYLYQLQFFQVESIETSLWNDHGKAQYTQNFFTDLRREMVSFEKMPLWEVPFEKLNQLLRDKNWIKTFRLRRIWPNQVKLDIAVEEISFVLINEKGKVFPIVESGKLLEPIPLSLVPDMMILRGKALAESLVLRQKAYRFFSQIPREGLFSQKTISTIEYKKGEGFLATLLQSPVIVMLGEGRALAKAKRVNQILEYFSSRGTEGRVIDARFSKKVLVKLRKDS